MVHTPVCDLLGIEHPIMQAAIWPATSPELVAAVSNAGGLGSLGALFETVPRLEQQLTRIRELTDRPFVVNHVVPSLNEEAFALTLEAKPAAISFALGDPGDLVARAHAAGCMVIEQVHTVRQGRQAAERGVDVIIAQGSEAGGQGLVRAAGIMALLPQIVDAVQPIPVLAAGGIADGRGLAAALVLGAQGVNLGTRFLASIEAGVSDGWKHSILSAESEDAIRFEVWTKLFPPDDNAYDAVPRVLRTAFIDNWHQRPEEARQMAEQLRGEVMGALQQGRVHEVVPFAGQSAGLVDEVLPAADIVERIIREAEHALGVAARFMT
jgi:nitronate monooxygenase/enoyl-[acyl-carrier protein] reductase II